MAVSCGVRKCSTSEIFSSSSHSEGPIKAQFSTTVNVLCIETVGDSWKSPAFQCCVHLISSMLESEKQGTVLFPERSRKVKCAPCEMTVFFYWPATSKFFRQPQPWQSPCTCQLPPYHHCNTSCIPLLRQSSICCPGPFWDLESSKVPPFPKT